MESEKEYLQLEELLTQTLEAFDSLQLKPSNLLCLHRKKMINLINKALTKIEAKKQSYLVSVAKLNSTSEHGTSSDDSDLEYII